MCSTLLFPISVQEVSARFLWEADGMTLGFVPVYCYTSCEDAEVSAKIFWEAHVKNWKHMQKPSVPVTVIFRRFFDDTGSPVVECCLKPVVPSVQKVFVPSENVIAPLQSLHRRQSMTLLGSTLQIQQPDFKLFQDTVSPTRHERYRKTSKECKCPVLNANGC